MRRRELLVGSALALSGLMSPCSRAETASDPPSAPLRNIRVDDPHLIAEGSQIQGLIDSPTRGPFIDLVRRLGTAAGDAPIDVRVTSRARVYRDVILSEVDWGFPMVRTEEPPLPSLGYRLSTASVGQVSFVIYSRSDRKLTRDSLHAALSQHPYPYAIIGPESFGLPFPLLSLRNMESALRMLAAGRCDGLLAPQEDVDYTARNLKLPELHRALYQVYDDVFLLPLGARGDFVDELLSRAVQKLQAGGELQALYSRIHRPYIE